MAAAATFAFEMEHTLWQAGPLLGAFWSAIRKLHFRAMALLAQRESHRHVGTFNAPNPLSLIAVGGKAIIKWCMSTCASHSKLPDIILRFP
jgi:hypothetical protein